MVATASRGFIANGVQGGALQPWLVRLNVDAFVGKGATYFVNTCGPDGCQGAQHTLGYTHGWVYLLVLTAAALAAALVVFRRRDVG